MKSSQKCSFHNQSGFTLIETMIVIAIVGVLAAIMIPNYNHFLTIAKTNACLSEAKAYSNQVIYLINDQDDETLPITPTPSACASITDATNWTSATQQKIIAIAKPSSNARIECDIPNGAPCRILH